MENAIIQSANQNLQNIKISIDGNLNLNINVNVNVNVNPVV